MESYFADNVLKKLSYCVQFLLPARHKGYARNALILLYIFTVNIFYPLSILLQLINNFQAETFKTILVFFASITLVWKLINVSIHKDKLSLVDDAVRQLDKQVKEHELKKFLRYRISVVNRIYALYICTSLLNWLGALISAVTTENIEFPAWSPLDWQSSRRNYCVVMIYQCFSHAGLIFQDSVCDLLRVVYVYTVAGHFHVLSVKVSRIGCDKSSNLERNYNELTDCIRIHQALLRIIKDLNNIISQTIFVVLIVAQINICLLIFYLFLTEDEISLKTCLTSYLITLLVFTTLQCYFGSELEGQGEQLTNSIYNCNWPEQDQRFRKSLLIFMISSQRSVQIKAGGVFPVSLPTCLQVFKSSYSLFALLQHLYG